MHPLNLGLGRTEILLIDREARHGLALRRALRTVSQTGLRFLQIDNFTAGLRRVSLNAPDLILMCDEVEKGLPFAEAAWLVRDQGFEGSILLVNTRDLEDVEDAFRPNPFLPGNQPPLIQLILSSLPDREDVPLSSTGPQERDWLAAT